MAYPQWHPVPCFQKLPVDIICTDNKDTKNVLKMSDLYHSQQLPLELKISCRRDMILFKDFCYSLERERTKNVLCYENHDVQFTSVVLHYLSKINNEQVIFAFPSLKKIGQIFYLRLNFLTDTFIVDRNIKLKENNKVWFIMRERKIYREIKFKDIRNKVYECINAEYVSIKSLHNSVADCEHGDDETDLPCMVNGQIANYSYCTGSCLPPNCTCPDLYYQHPRGGCFAYKQHCHMFSCKMLFLNANTFKNKDINFFNTRQIMLPHGNKSEVIEKVSNESIVNFYTDCTAAEIEEMSHNFINSCQNRDHMQCTYGCAKCFPVHKICVFELDQQGNLMHCLSGSHLKNCTKMDCNNMFKCTESYCIPYRFVNNLLFNDNCFNNCGQFQ